MSRTAVLADLGFRGGVGFHRGLDGLGCESHLHVCTLPQLFSEVARGKTTRLQGHALVHVLG